MLILHGVSPLGGVKQGWGGEKKLSLTLNVSLSRKTVGDSTKLLFIMTIIGSCIHAFD